MPTRQKRIIFSKKFSRRAAKNAEKIKKQPESNNQIPLAMNDIL